MTNMQAPKGVTQISVEQQNFAVSENGTVVVPETFVDALRDVGFRVVPARIVVSAEAAAAIAEAANKLNLPVPAEVVVLDTRAANAAKVKAQAEGVQSAGEGRINGSPREVVEAAAIEDPVKRAEALAALSAASRSETTESAPATPGVQAPEAGVGNQPTMSQAQTAEQNF